MRLKELHRYEDPQRVTVYINLDEPRTGRDVEAALDVVDIQGSEDTGVEQYTLVFSEPAEFAGRQYREGDEFPRELYQFVVLPGGQDLDSYVMDEIHNTLG